jgi:hypothetical protein
MMETMRNAKSMYRRIALHEYRFRHDLSSTCTVDCHPQ